MALDFWFSPWVLGLLGLCVGSFLNVVVYRLPLRMELEWLSDSGEFLQDEAMLARTLQPDAKRKAEIGAFGKRLVADCQAHPAPGLARPRSRCPSCGHLITWYENIPVLSWLMLKARCSACKTRISARYPLVEAATGALFAAVAWQFGATPATAVYCLAIALLLAAALIDLDTTLLPDTLTFPIAGLGLLAAWMGWTAVSLPHAALGLMFGYFSLWSVATLFKLLRGRQGMAEGDFRLLAGLGALLGWQQLLPIILLSSAVGALVGGYMVLVKSHNREVPIPFGPYLAGGGLAALFFGQLLLALMLPTLLPQ